MIVGNPILLGLTRFECGCCHSVATHTESSTMDTNRFAFTAARLSAVRAPAQGATQVYDERSPGLAVRVTPAGVRTFVFFRRVNGRVVRMKLGPVAAMSIDDARDAA